LYSSKWRTSWLMACRLAFPWRIILDIYLKDCSLSERSGVGQGKQDCEAAMENQDIRILRLLEAVEEEKSPSQRELARKLDISLGLVNSFLKRLAMKGYFKITNLPANRVRYLLTPKGLAEKTRLTYEYVNYSFSYYRQTRLRFKKVLAECARQGAKRMVFWGQGELAEIAYISLQEFPELEFLGLVDPGNSTGELFGRKTMKADELGAVSFDRVLITAIAPVEEIHAYLLGTGIAEYKIISL